MIIVQNLPVPLDRRVWLECQALVAAGYGVSVICPKGPGDPAYQELDGVRIYKYAPPPAAEGLVGYLVEFVYCWLRTALLSVKVRLRDGFDVIQACNPPDTYWLLAALHRVGGVKFVYDQHDLNPEVYLSRFGKPTGLAGRAQYRALVWLERRTFRLADHVISTNESYRAIAVRRGGLDPADTTVVRSGPDTVVMRPVDGDPELRSGRRHLLAYLGIMGPQDGVDVVIRAMDILVHKLGRTDIHVALLGFGDMLESLKELGTELDVAEYLTFTGRVGPREIADYLSAADLGVSPDPLNPLNDVSTMNKTMEYMSYVLPVVSFDLAETRISGGTAVRYVEPALDGDDEAAVRRFADTIAELLDAPDLRERMALEGRRRAEAELDWRPQRRAYVSVYDRLTGFASVPEAPEPPAPAEDRWGRPVLDTTDEQALRSFARTRRLP